MSDSARRTERDETRLRVWESEGGHLDATADAFVEATAALPCTPGRLTWWPAVAFADLAPGNAVRIDVDDHPICLVRIGGDVHALLDECSHGQVALSDGDVSAGLIECWQHGSCFRLDTGEPTGPPATTPVPVYSVRIVASVIEIAIPSVSFGRNCS